MSEANIDLLNKALRPGTIWILAVIAGLFLLGLGGIMLFRYAVFGEIDWQGLTAFLVGVLFPIMQHYQNRHLERRDELNGSGGGLINNQAIR